MYLSHFFRKQHILCLITIWLLSGGIVWAAEALPAPTITINPDIYYPFEEVIYIEGRAAPKEKIQVQFYKPGAKPLNYTIKSDAKGEWVLAEKIPLEEGDWEVKARLFKDQDTVSDWSNPRIFKAVETGITIGGVNIKFAALLFVILVLLVLGAGVYWYFILRVRQLKARLLSKEVDEAQESIREGLADVRKEILDELRLLESSGRRLTAAEYARKQHLLRELDRIERNIGREIRDIEKNI